MSKITMIIDGKTEEVSENYLKAFLEEYGYFEHDTGSILDKQTGEYIGWVCRL